MPRRPYRDEPGDAAGLGCAAAALITLVILILLYALRG
jgi:hypothetical protein